MGTLMALRHQHPGIAVDTLGNLCLHTQFLFPVYMREHTCLFPAATPHLFHGFCLLCSLGELLLSLQEQPWAMGRRQPPVLVLNLID